MKRKLLEKYIEYSKLVHKGERAEVTNKYVKLYCNKGKLDSTQTHNELLRNPIFIEVVHNLYWSDRETIEKLHNDIPELEKFIINHC